MGPGHARNGHIILDVLGVINVVMFGGGGLDGSLLTQSSLEVCWKYLNASVANAPSCDKQFMRVGKLGWYGSPFVNVQTNRAVARGMLWV